MNLNFPFSCGLVLDNSINIWDVRRPYIPFAAFQDAKEAYSGTGCFLFSETAA